MAVVIPLRKRGRPSRADDLDMELHARRDEEQRQAAVVEPHLRRLEMVCHEVGPVAWQEYAALATWHLRHRRRWDDDGAAA